MELDNWPIKVQLGSTNSKGVPVLFQGSHQGFLLNNQLIHYDGSNGHAHCHPYMSPIQCESKQHLPSRSLQPSFDPSIHPSSTRQAKP